MKERFSDAEDKFDCQREAWHAYYYYKNCRFDKPCDQVIKQSQNQNQLSFTFFDQKGSQFQLKIGLDELVVPGNQVIGGSLSPRTDQVCYLRVVPTELFLDSD